MVLSTAFLGWSLANGVRSNNEIGDEWEMATSRKAHTSFVNRRSPVQSRPLAPLPSGEFPMRYESARLTLPAKL